MAGVAVVRVASAADLLEVPGVEAAADELFRARGVLDLPPAASASSRARAWRVLVVGRPVAGFAVLERVDGDVQHGWRVTDDLGPELRASAEDEVELGLAPARSPGGHGPPSGPPRPLTRSH